VRHTAAVVDMYNKFGKGENKVANFLTVYIEEAHAQDDWKVPRWIKNPGGEDIRMHRTIEERIAAGSKFVADFNYPVEMVCDGMSGQAMNCYDALPERLYIIECGVVVYKGGQGPFFYEPREVLTWLETRFGVRE